MQYCQPQAFETHKSDSPLPGILSVAGFKTMRLKEKTFGIRYLYLLLSLPFGHVQFTCTSCSPQPWGSKVLGLFLFNMKNCNSSITTWLLELELYENPKVLQGSGQHCRWLGVEQYHGFQSTITSMSVQTSLRRLEMPKPHNSPKVCSVRCQKTCTLKKSCTLKNPLETQAQPCFSTNSCTSQIIWPHLQHPLCLPLA